MLEEDPQRAILYKALIFLAIPALLYFAGYTYWDSYLSEFGIDSLLIQLPVYTVMFYSWHALFVVLYTFIGLLTFVRITKIKEEHYEVHIGDIFAILAYIGVYAIYLLQSYRVSLLIRIVSIFLTLVLLIFAVRFSRRYSDKKLIFYHTRFDQPILLFLIIISLHFICYAEGEIKAKSIIEGGWKHHALMKLQVNIDAQLIPTDSLFLVASSDRYFYFLAPPNISYEKSKIYAVKKDLVSSFEVLLPKK